MTDHNHHSASNGDAHAAPTPSPTQTAAAESDHPSKQAGHDGDAEKGFTEHHRMDEKATLEHNEFQKGEFEYTPEEEKRMVRKMDLRVVSLVFLLYMFAFLRSNIGNANTAGMSRDLGFSNSQYTWLLTIFYIGYIIAQPGILLWKVLPAHIFVAALTCLWSLFALLQAAVSTWGGFMALRFLLGASETIYGPGVPYYLSFLYGKREVGLRSGLFLGAAPIASAYAGALAYGITHIKGAAIEDWRILFLIEGAPALLFVPIVWFCLPDRPDKARFLTERERAIAAARTRKAGDQGQDKPLNAKQVLNGLMDVKAWVTALMYFSANVSFSSLPVFLPTILSGMGFTSIRAQGLTAPPHVASFIVLVTVVWLGDRWLDRTILIIPLDIVSVIGFLILLVVKTNGVRYFAVYLACAGVFPVIALTLPLVASMHSTESKRGAGFMLLNIVGQCGPLLGTRMFPASDEPYYHKGFAVCLGFMAFHCFLTCTLRFLLIRENRRRDREYGKVSREAAYGDYAEQGEAHPNWRYCL